MRPVLALLLLGGCFGAGDDVRIGRATGVFAKWDTAKCTCDFVDSPVFGPTIAFSCAPMFDGGQDDPSLFIGIPTVPNTITRVAVADLYDEAGQGVALVEVSSEDPSAVWIDALVLDGRGTLEDVRMTCGGA